MRFASFWTICVVAVCAKYMPPAFADGADPAPQLAANAKGSYDSALSSALKPYERAVAIAKWHYLTALKSELNAAMLAGNLDEANRVKAEIDSVKNDQTSEAEKPKWFGAVEARSRYDSALRQANEDYDVSEAVARRKYVDALQPETGKGVITDFSSSSVVRQG